MDQGQLKNCRSAVTKAKDSIKKKNFGLYKYTGDTEAQCNELIGDDVKFGSSMFSGAYAKDFNLDQHIQQIAVDNLEEEKNKNRAVTMSYTPRQGAISSTPRVGIAPVMTEVIPENLKGSYKKFGIDKYYTKCNDTDTGCIPYEKLGTKDSMNQIQYCGPRVEGETTYENILVESCKPRNDIVGGKKSRRKKRKNRKTKKYNIKK